MAGIVTRRFRIHNAEQFREAFDEAAFTRMYVFIARSYEWANNDVEPTPFDTVSETRYDPWRDMIALKKVGVSDTSFVTDRYDWSSGTNYAEYSDTDSALYSRQFFVITDEFNVYKCLFNNNGAASTVKPTGTSTSTITTADGYKWKYMYTVSTADALKFLSTQFMPVKTLATDDGTSQFDVQQAASNGAIDVIDVNSGGSGWLENKGTVFSVSNSTVLAANSSASGTDNIFVGSTIFISTGLGSGQLREIVDYTGATRTITVNGAFSVTPNTSSQYHIGPNITITGDGTGATAYANVSAGAITKVEMINVGNNYSKATVTASANSSHGTGANLVARLSPPGGHGSDPVGELAGHNVMLNVKLTGSESNTFPTNNDFRIVGLIRDPLLANGEFANTSVFDQTTKLTLTNVTGTFQQDEFVDGDTSGAKGRVVTFANTNAAETEGVLKLISVDGTFTTEGITANTTGETATVSSVAAGDLTPFSGDVIYRENRSVTSRAIDQIEDVKIVVRY